MLDIVMLVVQLTWNNGKGKRWKMQNLENVTSGKCKHALSQSDAAKLFTDPQSPIKGQGKIILIHFVLGSWTIHTSTQLKSVASSTPDREIRWPTVK